MFDPYAINTAIRPVRAIDRGLTRRTAHERNVLVAELAARGGERAAAPFTRRRLSLFGGALALATAAFAGVMLASPPTSVAARAEGLSIQALHVHASADLAAAPSGHEN